jgi:hypothetical protein
MGLPKKKVDNTDKEVLNHDDYKKIFFIHYGENDEYPWVYLAEHNKGYYVYFFAACDYTGFDCQGGGDIIYSYDPILLWSHGLTGAMRCKIMLEKSSQGIM